jgi:hypothetical protein
VIYGINRVAAQIDRRRRVPPPRVAPEPRALAASVRLVSGEAKEERWMPWLAGMEHDQKGEPGDRDVLGSASDAEDTRAGFADHNFGVPVKADVLDVHAVGRDVRRAGADGENVPAGRSVRVPPFVMA